MGMAINILIKAKNLIAGELKRAEKQLNAFADGVKSGFQTAAKWVLGIGTAVTGAAVYALSAYAESQKAVTALESAHRAFGEEVENNVAKETALAAQIQNETAVSDDLTVARMASLRMLGVETESLGAAAKGVIALTNAGMAGEAAERAIANAYMGNTDSLAKFIPALKNCTDESKKAGIVNEFLTQNYQAQKDKLNTVSGRYTELKERIGDFWEEIGRAIERNGALQNVMHQVSEKVKAFTAAVTEWIDSGGVTRLIIGVKLFGENCRDTFSRIAIIAKGVFVGGIIEPAEQAWQYVSSVAKTSFAALKQEFLYMQELAKAVWHKISHPTDNFALPDTKALLDAEKAALAALKGGSVMTSKAWAEMYASLDAEAEKHNATIAKLSAEQLASYKKDNDAKVKDNQATLDEIKIATVNHAEELKKLAEQRKKLQEDMDKELREAEKEAFQKELEGLQTLIDKNKELVKGKIQGILDAKKAKDADRQEDARNADRADKLKDKIGRGTKIGHKDMDWLKAQMALEKAKAALPGLQDQAKIAADNVAQRAKDQKTWGDMLLELQAINVREAELLKAK